LVKFGLLNCKGQFFSPDLIIALGVFIFSMVLFWTASNFIYAQVNIFKDRVESDEIAHSVMNSLVLSSGQPINWEEFSLSDINSFGLVHSNNFLDENKLVSLVNLLNSSDYNLVRGKLGAGKFNIELSLIDSQGELIIESIELRGGVIVIDPVFKNSYTRLVNYNGSEYLLRIILSKVV